MEESSSSEVVASNCTEKRSCSNGDGDSERRIPHDAVIEVLLRLPPKSLMRFKCVSKLWYSTISSDSFTNAHASNSCGLIITFPDIDAISQPGKPVQRFLHMSPVKSLRYQASILLSEYNITQLINGLLCLYDCKENLILLCNIATREILTIPSPKIDYGFTGAAYYFGYDPISDLYKLLRICSTEHDEDYPCEILTLGIDSSWRTLNPATFNLKSQSNCINGVLYWGHWKKAIGVDHPRHTVVAFDLMEEKFWVIPHELTETNKWNRFNVMEIGGRLALAQFEACLFNDGKLILWELEDGGGGEFGLWKRHIVELPMKLREEGCCFPVGALPNGKLLLADYRIKSPMPVYCYDHTKRKFENFLLAKFPSSLTIICREAPRLQIIYQKSFYSFLRVMQLCRLDIDLAKAYPYKGEGKEEKGMLHNCNCPFQWF